MEDRLAGDVFVTPYEGIPGEQNSLDSSENGRLGDVQESENLTREPLLFSQNNSTKRKERSVSKSLKSTLKHVRDGLSNEKHVVADAFIDSSQNKPQYVNREYSNDLLVRARLKVLRGVDSLPVRLFGLAILIADIIFIIIEIALRIGSRNQIITEITFQILDLLFSAYFCIEVSLRIVGLGRAYFKRCFEMFDLFIVVLSSLLTVIYILLMGEDSRVVVTQSLVVFGSIRLFIIGRIIRVLFWARVVYEHKGIQRFFRNKVSQNKRRYIDTEFDLDLTYVTDRVIAMSFPSSGSEALYRNSIRDVGEFLDKNHFGRYRVYNLCSEREYDPSYFHNQVQRILIDDHNVPRFTDLVDFCEDVYTWMDANPDNVIVVHCKGGKGRTGTMVSAWLVRSGLFLGAGESLAYFKDRRTDTSRGEKSQGVQTPSQSRYVLYYERLLTKMDSELPPPVSLVVVKMTLHGLYSVGKGDGSDWNFEIIQTMNETVFSFDKCLDEVEVIRDSGNDTTEIVFSKTKPLILTDDVRVKFYCSTRSVPTGNDKCHFYFWFHTTFIENNRLTLDRSEVDNLQKSRLLRYYPAFFAIEMDFELSL